jgi:biotin carboxylase
MANGEVSFLETAARMGGVAIAKELDEVFGIDYVDLFLGVILGEHAHLPAFEAAAPKCAAASVAVIACDSAGTPWKTSRTFEPGVVDWQALVDGLARVHIQVAQSVPNGSAVPPYDISGGLLNYAGQAFLVSRTPADLKAAAYRLLDRLEVRLPLRQ